MPPKQKLSPETLNEARRSFDEGRATLTSIADKLGLSLPAFWKLRQKEGWPERRTKAAVKTKTVEQEPAGVAHTSANEGDVGTPQNTRQIAKRLETTVRKQLENVEARLRRDGADAAERNARILASLVKSLVELRRLANQDNGEGDRVTLSENGGSNEAPPRDLAELREELAAHLARMQPERKPEPGGQEI